jgi:intracellular sulfur oxidation DsrE/DsrF family protein
VLAKAKFEVVVYGPNVHLITSFSDVVPLIQKVQSEGIKVIACGRSLTSEHVSESDLAPGITVVPFGAVHIVNREKQGWQYIKP